MKSKPLGRLMSNTGATSAATHSADVTMNDMRNRVLSNRENSFSGLAYRARGCYCTRAYQENDSARRPVTDKGPRTAADLNSGSRSFQRADQERQQRKTYRVN